MLPLYLNTISKKSSTQVPPNPLAFPFCHHNPLLLLQGLNKYLPLLLLWLGWVYCDNFCYQRGWLSCHCQWREHTVRLIYVGNRFAVKYTVGCYPDLLPLFKAMQKYQGTPISAPLCAGHSKATDSLAPCGVYGVKLHLDTGSSCVTSCSRWIISNTTWEQAKIKFLLELLALLLLLGAILCSASGGRKFDLRSRIFFRWPAVLQS